MEKVVEDIVEKTALSYSKYSTNSTELVETFTSMILDDTLPHLSLIHFNDLSSIELSSSSSLFNSFF